MNLNRSSIESTKSSLQRRQRANLGAQNHSDVASHRESGLRRSYVMPTLSSSDVEGRIVHAAIALFSRQGYHGTSTREIARVADVSEVTVFRYFERKDELFWAALRSSFDRIKPTLDSLGRSPKYTSPEVAIPEIISLFVDMVTLSPELVRLVAIAFLELRGRAEEVCCKHLAPLFASISGFLAMSIESGRVRKLNPTITTIAIAMTIIAQPELAKLVGRNSLSALGSREAIDEYSAFWLDVFGSRFTVSSRVDVIPDLRLAGVPTVL